MAVYKKSEITSIRELVAHDGGRNLTPVFKGSIWPILVKVTKAEFEKVRGDEDAMKDLAIKKLNSK